jgi:hypothetical protein
MVYRFQPRAPLFTWNLPRSYDASQAELRQAEHGQPQAPGEQGAQAAQVAVKQNVRQAQVFMRL